MPVDLKLPTQGTCSFCGKPRHETHVFVGSSISTMQICDECLGLCYAMLAELAGEKGEDDVPSVADFSAERFETIVAAVAERYPERFLPVAPLSGVFDQLRCSFCDRRQRDVHHFIAGPRAYICEACIRDAATLARRELA